MAVQSLPWIVLWSSTANVERALSGDLHQVLDRERFNKIKQKYKEHKRERDLAMRVHLSYSGPLKAALHRDAEEIPLPDKARLRDLLRVLAERSGEHFKLYVFDLSEAWAKVEGVPESLIEGDQWRVLMAVNDVPHHQLHGLDTELADGDHVAVSLFFSGGG